MSSEEITRAHYDHLQFDDDLALLDDVPFTGIVYAHYPDGKPEVEFNYVEGLRSGIQKLWYSNGQLEMEWQAVRGQGSDWSREWAEDGTLIRETKDR